MIEIPEGDPKLIAELEELLKDVGPEYVWRTYSSCNDTVVEGAGYDVDAFPSPSALDVDFDGKTLVDMGCNFGHYTFTLACAGAARVTGLDYDKRMVRGAQIQKELAGVENVDFVHHDLLSGTTIGQFDMSLLIDFFGKTFFANGTAPAILDAAEAHAQSEMLVSMRPWYFVDRHLGGDIEGLKARYGAKYFTDERFHVLPWLLDRFEPRFTTRIVWAENDPDDSVKRLVHCVRR